MLEQFDKIFNVSSDININFYQTFFIFFIFIFILFILIFIFFI